ncbi:hypothetical protein B6A42_26815 (plasmid) [Vibrio coralliilyticus]|nr:hypothetical protein B6A42_26815 [Vibrio coralliilyticus]
MGTTGIVNDTDWLCIRAVAGYERDAEVLDEEVTNLKTCNHNAQGFMLFSAGEHLKKTTDI